MIGRALPVARLERADRRGRLESAHLRHLHVHQHDVERLRAPARRPPRGRCRPRHLWPVLSSRLDGQPLVDRVVFREQDAQRGDPAARREHRRPAAPARWPRLRGAQGRDGVQEVATARPAWSGASRCPTSRQRVLSSGPGRRVSIMIVAPPRSRRRADPPREPRTRPFPACWRRAGPRANGSPRSCA